MPVLRSCHFCRTMNDLESKFCRECGHQAHTLRLHCRCGECRYGAAVRRLLAAAEEAYKWLVRRQEAGETLGNVGHGLVVSLAAAVHAGEKAVRGEWGPTGPTGGSAA